MDYDKLTIIESTDKAEYDYGWLYGAETKFLTAEHLEALLEGKTIATGINDEYVLFLRVKDGVLDALKEIN